MNGTVALLRSICHGSTTWIYALKAVVGLRRRGCGGYIRFLGRHHSGRCCSCRRLLSPLLEVNGTEASLRGSAVICTAWKCAPRAGIGFALGIGRNNKRLDIKVSSAGISRLGRKSDRVGLKSGVEKHLAKLAHGVRSLQQREEITYFNYFFEFCV